MLRLRPSELTLTPDDVEETFRRIALRQPTRPQSSLPLRPFGQPGRPILRRGPQRATRDAVTALGKIPLLQPQQALVTSVDDSCEHTAAHEDISPIDRDSSNNQHVESVTSDHATQDGPAHLPASSASRAVEVALRACGESTTQSPPNGTACNAPCTPQRQLSESQRSGSADMSGDYALSAMESTPGLRGGGHVSRDSALYFPLNLYFIPSSSRPRLRHPRCTSSAHLHRVNHQEILSNHQASLARHFSYVDMSSQPQQAMCTIFTNPGKANPGGVVLVRYPPQEADLQGLHCSPGLQVTVMFALATTTLSAHKAGYQQQLHALTTSSLCFLCDLMSP